MSVTQEGVKLPSFVQPIKRRNGSVRYFFRRGGLPRARLPGQPGAPEFVVAYEMALAGSLPPRKAKAAIPLPKVAVVERYAKAVMKPVWHRAKGRSVKSGLAFDISLDDLAAMFIGQAGICALTEIPFQYSPSGDFHKAPFAPSLDRIDNSKGYIRGNIRLVCVAMNFALGEWGEDTFRRMARAYLRTRTATLPRNRPSDA